MSDIPKDVVEGHDNISNTSNKVSDLNVQTSNATVIALSPEELQQSVHIIGDGPDHRNWIENSALKGAYMIYMHLDEYKGESYRRSAYGGIDAAYDILNEHPNEKVVMYGFFNRETMLHDQKQTQISSTMHDKLLVLAENRNFRYLQIPFTRDELNSCFAKESSPEIDLEDLQKSFNFDFLDPDFKEIFEREKREITNQNLHGAYFIDALYTENGKHGVQEFYGTDVAYDILQKDPTAKVVLIDTFIVAVRKKIASGNSDKLNRLLENNQCRYIFTGTSLTTMISNLNAAFTEPLQSNSEVIFEAEKRIAYSNISRLRHDLHYVKNPYHPSEEDQPRLEKVFELSQRYFPGLDTIEKMLDYVFHIEIDIPEVMKGERIEGVYVDVDGTLIDYVPIGSPLEGTQQLRQPVVELLKKYESEGKKIIVRTGGNVEMKEEYLRSLGITRPVVSKYDYAGATAEIVVDDTDKSAFILQSKIMPETYIDTRNMQ